MNEVTSCESFMPGLDDDVIEVEHLLAEPKSDHVSVEGVFTSDKDNLDKGMQINDERGRYQNLNSGCAYVNAVLGLDRKTIEVFGNLSSEVAAPENSYAMDGLSSTCDDYLLDIEFAEKDLYLDIVPASGSSLDNSGLESQSPVLSGSINGTVGVSESSSVSFALPDCKFGMLEETAICNLHYIVSTECVSTECELQQDIMGKNELKSSTSDDSRNLYDIRNMSNYLGVETSYENEMELLPSAGCMSGEKHGLRNVRYQKTRAMEIVNFGWDIPVNSSGIANKKGSFYDQKRLRKATKRYIEEFSDIKTKHLNREKNGATMTKNVHLGLGSCAENGTNGFKIVKLPSNEDPYVGYPQKYVSISDLDSDEDTSSDESEDDAPTRKKSRRSTVQRKHQRIWTLPEVIKLVDGITQFGVGRWTDIKRLSFATAHRTPIDLRDKWRNLLRASSAWLESEREDEQKQKYSSRVLPKELMHRVSELARKYPYPGHGGTKYVRSATKNSVPFTCTTRQQSKFFS